MAVIVEDGSRPAGANSYVDPAGAAAVAYFAGHLYASAWTAATSGTREAAVVMATRTLDATYIWNGQTTDADQALGWPRYGVRYRNRYLDDDVVPKPVVDATLEMALALINRDRTSDTSNASPLTGLNLGDGALQLDFGAAPAVTVTALPDIVADMLRELGSRADTNAGMVRIYRR